jgi:hypothetical protein
MIVKHFATVNSGKIIFSDFIKWQKNINQLSGCEVYLTISKKTKQRSLNENAYYWGVVLPLAADFLGYTIDEAHEAFKWQFLRVYSDKKLPSVKSTADLSTVEFEAYLTKIREELSTMGCFIPLPNEVACV